MKKKIVGGSSAKNSSLTFSNSLLMAFQDGTSRTMWHAAARPLSTVMLTIAISAESFTAELGADLLDSRSNKGTDQRLEQSLIPISNPKPQT